MDLENLPIFSLLKEKMSYLSERQKVIAGNLANADTPGYRAQTVQEPDFSRYLGKAQGSISMARTDPRHISSGPLLGGVSAEEAAIHGHAASPDGNTVDISDQAMELADTQIQYNLATNIYRKHVQLLRTALGQSGS